VDDRGLAALAAALTDLFPAAQHDRWPFTPQQVAAAILGERGVFLPDGLPIPADCMAPDVHHEWTGPMRSCGCPNATEQAATIARLRAALDGLRADDLWLGVELHAVGNLMFPEPMVSASGARAAIRAALARAKEATDGR
jgi:hypothetical protein